MIKLNVKERLMMKTLLPENADFIKMSLVTSIAKNISFSQEEIEEFGLTVNENGTNWTNDAIVEVNLTDTEIAFLKDRVAELDVDSKVTVHNFELCKKIKDA